MIALQSSPAILHAQPDPAQFPDSLALKDGSTARGLIVANTAHEVVLQQATGETAYPKREIVRIFDNANDEFTAVLDQGKLPPWSVIANDLRTHDQIRTLEEIPATTVDKGEFQNVPYRSFRVNQDVELNIYGDPNDPAALEIGVFGSRSGDEELRQLLRSYLAGFLTTRAEIAALYSLDLDGGEASAGDMTLEITPKDAPDAYGAWWISLYNRKTLDDVRLSDDQYARLTLPVEEVLDPDGRVRAKDWTPEQLSETRRLETTDGQTVLLRGFYRDENGTFRLVTQPTAN